MYGLDMSTRRRCVSCGRGDRSEGTDDVPVEARPFVRGQRIVVMNNIGVCGVCYATLCSRCAAPGGRCSRCHSPHVLFAHCPTNGPPWWRVRSWLRWRRAYRAEYD
jgi:hypothetical protein